MKENASDNHNPFLTKWRGQTVVSGTLTYPLKCLLGFLCWLKKAKAWKLLLHSTNNECSPPPSSRHTHLLFSVDVAGMFSLRVELVQMQILTFQDLMEPWRSWLIGEMDHFIPHVSTVYCSAETDRKLNYSNEDIYSSVPASWHIYWTKVIYFSIISIFAYVWMFKFFFSFFLIRFNKTPDFCIQLKFTSFVWLKIYLGADAPKNDLDTFVVL